MSRELLKSFSGLDLGLKELTLPGVTAKLFPKAAERFVGLLQGRSGDRGENLNLNLRNGFNCIWLSAYQPDYVLFPSPVRQPQRGLFQSPRCHCKKVQ